MKKKVQYPVVLTIVTLLASIGVSSTYLTTKEKIREKESEVRTRALFTVLPGIDETPEEISPPNTKNQDKIYKGVNGEGELIGYAASGEAQGYSSRINVMVGLDSNLEKILGIDIISQRETPGLGTKMVEKESSDTLLSVLMSFFGKTSGVDHGKIQQLPEFNMHQGKEGNNSGNGAATELRPWFQEQFKDKTYNQLVVSKVADKEKITAITGATISTNAAVKAVQNAIEKIKIEYDIFPTMKNIEEIKPIVEALLFSAEEPLSSKKICNIIDDVDAALIKEAITLLQQEYNQQGRAFQIEEIAGGFQLYTLPEYHEWISKLRKKSAETKLSSASLETLAIIAYKQPVLRADVESIRGVQSGQIIRLLMEKDLVKVVGRDEP